MSYLVCCNVTVLSFHGCVCKETVVVLGIRYEWWLVGVKNIDYFPKRHELINLRKKIEISIVSLNVVLFQIFNMQNTYNRKPSYV
jgi:hypothetical protein